jgi:hypothetical protein
MRGVISQHHPELRRTSKELPAAPQLQKYLRPSLSSTHTQPTGERMETACSDKFYT